MANSKKHLFLLLMVMVLAVVLIGAGDPAYIGVKKCAMCHKGEAKGKVYEKWLESKHAQALKALDPAKGEDKNETCLACHTTGYKSGGYALDIPNKADFEGVQCEACHGAGSNYKAMNIMKDKKLALANGMVMPTEETCKKCHNAKSPTFKSFDYKEALKKIDHTFKKATT
jgi:hypothetical protein